jgi:hypothetical protein
MTVPIARSIASRPSVEIGRIWADLDEVGAREVDATRPPSRISARALATLGERLGDLDWTVVSFVADHRLARGDQLRRRFFLGDTRAARRLLSRLADWRVLDRLPRRVGGVRRGSDGFVYCLGPAGHRLLAARGLKLLRIGRPGERHINHTLAVTELVVRLFEAHHQGELELIAADPEPVCWRPFVGPGGARVVLKPDLAVRLGVGALEDRWLVEVDLATEHRATIASKAKRYAAHARSGTEQREFGVYPRVLWTVPDAQRATEIADALGAVPAPARSLFQVALAAEAVDYLAREARA